MVDMTKTLQFVGGVAVALLLAWQIFQVASESQEAQIRTHTIIMNECGNCVVQRSVDSEQLRKNAEVINESAEVLEKVATGLIDTAPEVSKAVAEKLKEKQ